MKRALLVVALAGVCGGSAGASLSDPTRPPGYAPPAPRVSDERAPVEWRLTMIRIGPHGAWAVINGERVAEGNTIGPARVLAVRAAEVVLDEAGVERRLALVPRPAVSPAAPDSAADPSPDAADARPPR